MKDLTTIDVYQGDNRKSLTIGNHRISVGKAYGFLTKVETYQCYTKDILDCTGIDYYSDWIPCSKALPENGMSVNITFRNKNMPDETFVGTATRGDDVWYFYHLSERFLTEVNEETEVLAWMPLPKPYKQNGDEENETDKC